MLQEAPLLIVLGRWENRDRYTHGVRLHSISAMDPQTVTASSWIKELFPNVSYFGPQRFSSADFNCSKSAPTERAHDHSKLKELQKLGRPESPISSLLSTAALHFSEKCQGESQTPVNTRLSSAKLEGLKYSQYHENKWDFPGLLLSLFSWS